MGREGVVQNAIGSSRFVGAARDSPQGRTLMYPNEAMWFSQRCPTCRMRIPRGRGEARRRY